MLQSTETSRLRSALVLVVAALLTFTLAGSVQAQTPLDVGLSNDDTVDGDGLARFRVVHNSPDAPSVDILIDDAVALAGVPFFTVSDYLAAPPGTYNVKVNAAGTATTVIEADLTLAGDTYYTVIARGTLAEIAPTVLVDETAMPPAAGNAKVRVFHGSPDAPAVDITLTDGTVLVPGLTFPNASGYLEVPAGSYDLQIRVAGTDIVALNLPTLDLDAGEIYTAYAKGLLAQGAADRTLYLQDGRFRVDSTWEDFDSNTGVGLQQGLTDDTGYFYFFNEENVELVIKVLDGLGVNGNFWVFYGSLSNVGYEIVVTDTQTGTTRTFVNPLGEFASFGDVGSFPGN
ncbi:MAG: DUF4397 domain-containing protein [Acidobacteriota bacterium]